MKFAYVAFRPVVCSFLAIVNAAQRYHVLESMFMISKPHNYTCHMSPVAKWLLLLSLELCDSVPQFF